MNSYKTELFKVSFDTNLNKPDSVTIEWLDGGRCGDYDELYSISEVCSNVDTKLQDNELSPAEAIRIIRKASSFFIMSMY